MCDRPDVNPIVKSCTRKLKCSDARCLRSKVGQRFMIERECCCAPTKCTNQRFRVEIAGIVAQGPTGVAGSVTAFFEYDACAFSNKETFGEFDVYALNEPAQISFAVFVGSFQPVPIQSISVSKTLVAPIELWIFGNDFIRLAGGQDSLPTQIPTKFFSLNELLVSQYNEGGVWVLDSVRFVNAMDEVVILGNTTMTITKL